MTHNGPPYEGEPVQIADEISSDRVLDRPAPRQITLTLRPEPGVNSTRALRGLLKIALRTFGLRCLRIEESA